MKFHQLCVLTLTFHVVPHLSDSDTCSSKDSCTEDQNVQRYTAKTQLSSSLEKYLAQYQKANAEHVACESEECGGCFTDLIHRDLQPFKNITFEDLIEARDTAQYSVTYQIVEGRLYRSAYCLFPNRCSGIEYFLHQVIEKTPSISDIEFVVNTHDWPHIHKHFHGRALPLFSFSKTAYYSDITYPAWTFWEGGPSISLYPRGIGRWDVMREEIAAALAKWPWEQKMNKGFFRGSRTSPERDNLVLLSRKHPDLIDAKYTKNQAWKSKADTLNADPASEVSLPDHCQYRYLFNFRGVAASFRFKHLFLCESLVFHVGNEWTEFFYHALRPWIHYIPVDSKASQSELQELLLFARNHPEISKQIAENGRKFVDERLQMTDVTCYWKKLLLDYAKLLTFNPKRNPDYIEISKGRK